MNLRLEFLKLLLNEEYFEMIKDQKVFTEKERSFNDRKFKSINNIIKYV